MRKYLPTVYTASCQDCDWRLDENKNHLGREAGRHARKEGHLVLLRKIDSTTYEPDNYEEVK